MTFTVSPRPHWAFPLVPGSFQFHGGAGLAMEVATSGALQLPYTAPSVGMARRRLIGDLTEAGVYEGMACDAGLVLSELISNALRHASPLPGRTVRVSWRLAQGSVQVAVSDGGGPTVPMVNEPSNWSLGGRGLGIVARLSLRWGVCVGDEHWNSDPRAKPPHALARDCPGDCGPGETTVWAELPVRYGTSASLVIASSRDA
jgi:anti-sigma regulatory factor (Ser/Thr protein kinase)